MISTRRATIIIFGSVFILLFLFQIYSILFSILKKDTFSQNESSCLNEQSVLLTQQEYSQKLNTLQKELDSFQLNTNFKKQCVPLKNATEAVILWLGTTFPLTVDMLMGKQEVKDYNLRKWIIFFWHHYHVAIEHQYQLIIVSGNGTLPVSVIQLLQNNCVEFLEDAQRPRGWQYYNYRFEAITYALEKYPNIEAILHMDMDSTCISNPFLKQELVRKENSKIFIASSTPGDGIWQRQIDLVSKGRNDHYINLTERADIIRFTPNPIAGRVSELAPILNRMHNAYIKYHLHNITNTFDMGIVIWAVYAEFSPAMIAEKIHHYPVYTPQNKMPLPCFHLKGIETIVRECYAAFFRQKDFYHCMVKYRR